MGGADEVPGKTIVVDDYDPGIDACLSWEAAIAALRERHLAEQAAKLVPGKEQGRR